MPDWAGSTIGQLQSFTRTRAFQLRRVVRILSCTTPLRLGRRLPASACSSSATRRSPSQPPCCWSEQGLLGCSGARDGDGVSPRRREERIAFDWQRMFYLCSCRCEVPLRKRGRIEQAGGRFEMGFHSGGCGTSPAEGAGGPLVSFDSSLGGRAVLRHEGFHRGRVPQSGITSRPEQVMIWRVQNH